MSRTPEKRPAFEPAALLVQPQRRDPGMTRPTATVAGALLVLLRALAGVLWIVSLTLGWDTIVAELAVDETDPIALSPQESHAVLWGAIGVFALIVVVDVVLAVLIFRGANWPRVLVMIVSALSICTSFSAWWFQGQELRLGTTLLSIALDILVLLALSSREAAAYARRNERMPEDGA